jgi:hypothetical protein
MDVKCDEKCVIIITDSSKQKRKIANYPEYRLTGYNEVCVFLFTPFLGSLVPSKIQGY